MGSTLKERLDILFLDSDFKFEGSPTVAVVGAGVAGVTTALSLHKCGAKVVVFSAQESSSNTPENLKNGTYPITSQIAGALWEFPPAVCGAHNDIDSEENAKHWSVVSYRAFAKVAADPTLFPNAGVAFHPSTFFYHNNIKDYNPGETKATLTKMLNIAKNPYISGFEYNNGSENKILNKYNKLEHPFILNKGIKDAFQHDAALIDTDLWMDFLRSLLKDAGIPVYHRVVQDFYKEQNDISKFVEEKGHGTPKAFVIATGLNSYYVVGDKNMYARRGAVYRFPHKKSAQGPDPLDGVAKIPNINILKDNAFCIPVSELNDIDNEHADPNEAEDTPGNTSQFAFVIPRGDHATIVGGFSEALSVESVEKSFQYYRDQNKMDAPYVRRKEDWEPLLKERVGKLRKKGVEFLAPVKDLFELHDGHDLDSYLFYGLRPFRKGGCRLELQENTNIVHNYGHGGSGVSWSIGCAVEATHLVRKHLTGHNKPIDAGVRALLRNLTREYVYFDVSNKGQSAVDIYGQDHSKSGQTHSKEAARGHHTK